MQELRSEKRSVFIIISKSFKSPESGKRTFSFRPVRIWTIFWTSEPDVMSGRALVDNEIKGQIRVYEEHGHIVQMQELRSEKRLHHHFHQSH